MKISRDHVYAHSADDVFRTFTEVDEITAKQEALGARDICIDACDQNEEGAIVVRFNRELPIELGAELPAIVTKFLQPWNRVEQAEEWYATEAGGYTAELSIDVANIPVTISGTLELKPLDDGCVNEVRLNVDCGIPLVGKPLADFVGTDCKRTIAAEYDYITERLQSE